MKALSVTIQKIWPMLKFLQTDRQTVAQAKKYMPPIFRYGGIKKALTVYMKIHPSEKNVCVKLKLDLR
jgi:hypothetical protein